MKYIVIAVVRYVGTEETWTEIFTGDVHEHQDPSRLAPLGVSDLNAALRKEDMKLELVGSSWFKTDDASTFIGKITGKYTSLIENDTKALLALETVLDSAASDVYSKQPAETDSRDEKDWKSTNYKVGLQPSKPWPDDSEPEEDDLDDEF